MLVHAFVMCRLVVLLICDLSKYVIQMFQSLENFIWSYVVVNMTTLLQLYSENYIGFPWSMSRGFNNHLCPSYNNHLFHTYKSVRSLLSSTMNLSISDTQIKAKILSAIMLFHFVSLNFGMILQSTYIVKWSLNECFFPLRTILKL